jgi:hypothetical protein
MGSQKISISHHSIQYKTNLNKQILIFFKKEDPFPLLLTLIHHQQFAFVLLLNRFDLLMFEDIQVQQDQFVLLMIQNKSLNLIIKQMFYQIQLILHYREPFHK